MKYIRALLAAVLWTSGLTVVGAQEENEEDFFDSESFTQSVAESKQSEEENKLEYLIGGVFLAAGTTATTADFTGYTASGSFAGKAFVRISVPRYGSLYIGGNLSHTLAQGQSGSGLIAAPDTDRLTPTLALSEFYLSFDLAKALFFRIGSQLIAWGPSVIWTPVDFINLQKLDPQASLDLRVGKPSVRVHVPLKSANFFLFTDFGVSPVVQDLWKSTNYGLRADLTVIGFELGLTGYLGYLIQNRYGFDFSGRVLAADIYGELALYLPYGSYEFNYAYALGFQRVFGELKDWTLQGEFYYSSTGAQDETAYAALIAAQLFKPLYVGRMYAYAALTKQDLIGTILDCTLSGIMNISDLSFTVRLKGGFEFPNFIPFSVSLAYSGGGSGKEFTVFSGDNSLSGTLEVRFEF